MTTKKNPLKRVALGLFSKAALNQSQKMANSTCFYWQHQPKMPAGVQQLKKHK